MKDYEHPFFKPLWRRVAVVAVCVIWAILEFVGGEPFWGTIAFGFAAYGIWQFFLIYKPADERPASESADSTESKE